MNKKRQTKPKITPFPIQLSRGSLIAQLFHFFKRSPDKNHKIPIEFNNGIIHAKSNYNQQRRYTNRDPRPRCGGKAVSHGKPRL